MSREQTELHTRIMKCALEVEDARAYWAHRGDEPPSAQEAFEGYWFGARSLARVKVLLANFRLRFDAWPEALTVLHGWSDMDPATRRLICHWHLQLADPLYRRFTGTLLPSRRGGAILRQEVLDWVATHGKQTWTRGSRVQFASKLFSSAFAANLLDGNRDPRRPLSPVVPDEAILYLLHLLRGTDFEGTLLDNPYLRSVGLEGRLLDERLRRAPGLRFRRMGELTEMGWQHSSLTEWATDTLGVPQERSA